MAEYGSQLNSRKDLNVKKPCYHFLIPLQRFIVFIGTVWSAFFRRFVVDTNRTKYRNNEDGRMYDEALVEEEITTIMFELMIT